MCYFSLVEEKKITIIDLDYVDEIRISRVTEKDNVNKIAFFDKQEKIIHESFVENDDIVLFQKYPLKESF